MISYFFTIFDNTLPEISFTSNLDQIQYKERENISLSWEANDNSKIDSTQIFWVINDQPPIYSGSELHPTTSALIKVPSILTTNAKIKLIAFDNSL